MLISLRFPSFPLLTPPLLAQPFLLVHCRRAVFPLPVPKSKDSFNGLLRCSFQTTSGHRSPSELLDITVPKQEKQSRSSHGDQGQRRVKITRQVQLDKARLRTSQEVKPAPASARHRHSRNTAQARSKGTGLSLNAALEQKREGFSQLFLTPSIFPSSLIQGDTGVPCQSWP